MRRLVAALACRAQGSRLYGKPLQNLDIEKGTTVLDHMISMIQTLPPVQAIVLGVAEGAANSPFVELAQRRGVDCIRGDEKDVLKRLIDCGHKAQGTDVFRVTTESPFTYYDMMDEAWERHVKAGNDVTTVDGLPEGSHFEIYKLEALAKSHKLGDSRHRSEFCSLYIREHRGDFKVEVLPIPRQVERLDLRLTIDYPEDLVLCRHVYAHLRDKAPRLPLAEIIAFLDGHPELTALVKPYVVAQRLW
ncbi:MAG: acylneuraminate cytidylyltransferase [Chloroflexi bacterium]|nr:acylneuraminate cytidylyltransferase [Chloroflexota bacterium]